MPAALAINPVRKVIFMSQAQIPSGARKFEVTCSSCNLREMCLPGGVCVDDLSRVENIVYARRRVKRGEAAFKAGDEFNAIYAIRSGFFKTSLLDDEGREQVTGFFMGGELLGMDGVGSGRYNGNAIALEDSEVCVMPFSLIEAMSREVPSLQRHLHAVLAREIVRDHGVMMLLGSMRAEERLATFLINLRLTREELGSYLGLKLETVSRLFSQFQKEGLIEVNQKHIRILDIAGLERMLGSK
jgi:CRP/FNR family transcriptional regulator